jgi:tetratricopeptide (TPR) repeat protein
MPPEKMTAGKGFRFDVAFSFAGPHREKVKAIAELIAAKIGKKRVFFDEWYRAEILGGNMRVLLQRIYGEKSLMVVADLSQDYADRPWCQGESEAIDALRMRIDSARDETSRLRVFIVRFGPGEVPGVLENTGWLDGITLSAEEVVGVILERLALLNERMAESAASPLPQPVPSSPSLPSSPSSSFPPILFFHAATNDAFYSRRERELDWLDTCAKDKGIRIATVTGIGGLGKTSLVGHWIDVRKGWQHRAFRGVFFYSFYSDREAEHFFPAFLKFVCKTEKIARIPQDKPLHHLASYSVQRWSYLVVLDGLEVLQHGEEERHYGWIANGALNEFVARAGATGESLLILTSRFPFPEITNEQPHHARANELPLLEATEGADLLARCGLADARENLEAHSTQFGGHPLALRLFAGACMAAPFTDPSEASRTLIHDPSADALPDPDEAGIAADERQRRKQRRQFYKLLTWFQKKLPASKRRLLQIVALFKEPVATNTIVRLAQGLDAMRSDFGNYDAAHIYALLDGLVRQHLLQREDVPGSDTARWAAHPIVREVFRAEALKSGETVAAQFAEIVAGKAEGGRPKSVTELQPVFEAIDVLLAAGDFKAADELFIGRLHNGQVFKWIPAPQEGLRCVRSFLEPASRKRALEEALGRRRLASHLNTMALLGTMLGEMETVERGYEESNLFDHERQAWDQFSVGLRNLSEAQTLRGALREAVDCASEALFYAGVAEAQMPSSVLQSLPPRPTTVPPHDALGEVRSHAYRAHAFSLAGELFRASRDFGAADTIERREHYGNAALYSNRGVYWCRHRLRLGDTAAARSLTMANRAICESNAWNHSIAQCDLLLGELDLEDGELDSAARWISEAVRVFREAGLVQYLPDALIAQARVRQSVEDCEEALRLAARSGLAVMQCDALNLRALLRREVSEFASAAEDAHDALEIAERCGYYWGRHEAFRQLRDAAKASGSRADEKHWDEAEQVIGKRIQPLIKEALEIEHAHDREMKKLYGRNKKTTKKKGKK